MRYFNKETGYGGKPYEKKTDKAMCDELGDNEYMQALVEEAGKTSLCNALTEAGCDDKTKTFIGKWNAKGAEAIKKEHGRLEGMAKDSSSMKPEAHKWLQARIKVLKQLSEKQEL